MFSKRVLVLSLVLVFTMAASASAFFIFPSWDDPLGQDVVVYIGEAGTDTYELSLNGVMFTEEQIGLMADRILWTEGQIGLMADRIVYVIVMSQDNSVEVIYQLTTASLQFMDGFWNLYYVTLEEVSSLPEGWTN